ncbi:facilitated trehalose transporter Tret1-2 homolog isoform X1 [Neodiprion fabricii]|uniref:facilitated trehalose transporter Tret1-2 homolog isoform X1 n=2 Tax=Neodiprion fabricii TaxID=2872261 RepID=UPI001ED8F37D|nr:facilitated trehalose transporter Tret1-2 homolog isoform X1 [Neodiprion fabricii]XP_046410560.1 facilitated trehalose transporter Tret1-2 homolog isoform X1 [Neodiprion fabricii]XP_046410561.1 facilitated trehalose transporter Tret1-2 homolog isoform X1 [Neodiprion fabricii]XP_046410562.1 facilitated trehalose transporter Tret1-2 homolog isoform X1 [Neodiprion fabricii]
MALVKPILPGRMEKGLGHHAQMLLNSGHSKVLGSITKKGGEKVFPGRKHGAHISVVGTKHQYSSNPRGVFAQCLVTGAVLLLAAGCGMPIGYSAILLPKLAQTNGSLQVDEDLGSWIASVHSLAAPFGSLLSGPLMDAIGRRGALQISAIPLAVGWIVMGLAQTITCIIAGRIMSGFAVGLVVVPGQVLLGEIADPGLRGILVGAPFATYSFGILLVYALGASFAWRTVAFCGMILPGLALVALCLSPESPVWLVRRRKTEAARKALSWFRGADVMQVKTEMAQLESRAREDIARISSTATLRQQASSALSNILSPGVIKPLAIINVFNFLQTLSGTYVFVFYAVEFIREMEGDGVDHYLVAVITAAVRFVFCLVSCVLLLTTGRRVLGIISALGTAVTSLVLAGYLLARKGQPTTDADMYVVGTCIIAYVSANTVGLLTLPGLMVGELLPQHARGIGGGCTFFLFNLTLFGVTKVFPGVKGAIGMTGIFTVFGASALLEAVFVYVALPEAKGRTLQEIEDYFQEGNVLWVTRKKQPKINSATTPLVNV